MKRTRPSPLGLAVLGLLYEAPMHPYKMQRLIQDRRKDEVINVRRRASLYQTIDRLARAKLIVARETVKEGGRPERTVYEITEEGKRTAIAWLRNMLRAPAAEFPQFPAALAYLPMLAPEEAREELEHRLEALKGELARMEGEHREAVELVPRLFLVESEYTMAVLRTEIAWVAALVEDLRTGQLTWDDAWLRAVAERFEPGVE